MSAVRQWFGSWSQMCDVAFGGRPPRSRRSAASRDYDTLMRSVILEYRRETGAAVTEERYLCWASQDATRPQRFKAILEHFGSLAAVNAL